MEKRRREFVTARRCAREALASLGQAPGPIGVGPSREPQWPAGLVGSITHTRGFRAAAVAPQSVVASIGIDAEQNEPLPDGVEKFVSVEGELEMLAALTVCSPGRAVGAPIVQRERSDLQSLVSADESLARF